MQQIGNLYDPKIMDEEIKFSDKGKAQVSKDVGEKLIEKYDLISASENAEVKKDKPEVKDIG